MNEKTQYEPNKRLNQWLFFVAFFSWVLYLELQTITMYQNFLPSFGFVSIRLFCYSVLVLKGVVELIETVKQKQMALANITRYIPFLLGILFVCLSLVIAIVTKNTVIFDVCFLIFSARNQDIEKITKYFCIMQIGIMLACIAGVLIGYLPDRVSARTNGDKRYAFGYAWTNFPAHAYLYLSLMVLFLKELKVRWYELALMAGGSLFWFYFTDTKNSFLLNILVVFVYLFVKWQYSRISSWRVLDKLSAALVPLISTTVLVTSYYYSSDSFWMKKINSLVSNRLYLGHKGVRTYGIPIVGQEITFIDNITKYEMKNDDLPYNFIDSSFVNILVTKGIIFYLFIVAGLTVVVYRLVHNKRLFGAIAILFAIVHSTFDPQLLDLWFSPFPLLIGKLFATASEKSKKDWVSAASPLL